MVGLDRLAADGMSAIPHGKPPYRRQLLNVLLCFKTDSATSRLPLTEGGDSFMIPQTRGYCTKKPLDGFLFH
jgi:hypothetical protein